MEGKSGETTSVQYKLYESKVAFKIMAVHDALYEHQERVLYYTFAGGFQSKTLDHSTKS